MRSPWGGTGREPSADCPSNDPTDVGKHQQRRKLSAQRDGGADVQGCAGQTDANTILDVRRRRTASHPVATEQTEQKTRNRADPRSKALRKGLRAANSPDLAFARIPRRDSNWLPPEIRRLIYVPPLLDQLCHLSGLRVASGLEPCRYPHPVGNRSVLADLPLSD